MIEDIAIATENRKRIVAREILAHLATGLLYPFGIGRTKHRTKREKQGRTVVLIHGYLGNRSSLFPLAAYLRLRGVNKILTFNYRWDASPEQAAKELKRFLQKHVRGGRIDLVAHSLGGIVARIFLQQLGGARRVDRCITLGTPHEGTYNAYWAPSKVGDDLRPNSALLKKLKGSQPASGRVRYHAIIGGSDNIVIPRVFASVGHEVTYLPNLGHLGLLFSPRVFKTVADRLAA